MPALRRRIEPIPVQHETRGVGDALVNSKLPPLSRRKSDGCSDRVGIASASSRSRTQRGGRGGEQRECQKQDRPPLHRCRPPQSAGRWLIPKLAISSRYIVCRIESKCARGGRRSRVRATHRPLQEPFAAAVPSCIIQRYGGRAATTTA